MPGRLIGTTLWTCRRAADMATFQFGQRRRVLTFDGRPTEIGEHALHVQCPWRIVGPEGIVVGSQDLYYPAHPVDDNEPLGDFDWHTNPNRRDMLIAAFFQEGNRELTVRRVHSGLAGSCRIEFEGGYWLELFPSDSVPDEHWRVFTHDDDAPHVVISGAGGST